VTIRNGGRPRDPRSAAWSPDPRSINGRRLRHRRGSSIGGVLRFLAFALVLGAIVVGGALTILRPVVSDALVSWGYDNPGALRIPFVADLVKERLGSSLTTAPSRDGREVVFTVNQGDNVESIAERLEEEGLVIDARAFVVQATERSLAGRLSAGDFALARNMTPDQVVTGLIENEIVEPVEQFVEKIFREGLRIDQMAAFIQTWEEDLAIDAAEFREIASAPSAELLADYPWLQASGLPEGASLEGYLFPAAYDLTEDMTSEELVRAMLDRFIREVGQERVAQAAFFERLTLASIVEREARVPEERPLVAGVYQNRLSSSGAGQILNADPTVFYAIDTVKLRDLPFEEWVNYLFWDPPGVSLAEVQLPPELAPYNTYQVRGLPPGPICAPGLASIEAAFAPDTEDGFLYFLAIPDGSGKHVFARTPEEHNANRAEYGYE
jgi:UPF0755 protein